MTFNARRGVECSKLKLHHWEAVEDCRWKQRTDVQNLEDPLEIKLAKRMELKLLTPTRTRKFLANLLQLMDMNDAELTRLTNHFGHTKDVHFQWCRNEDATLELTKVAKVLAAVDDGQSVKNKRINQMSTLEQAPGSSCCNRINNLEKVWKDKSSQDSPSYPGMKIYIVSAWLDSLSIVEIFIVLVLNTL